MEPSVLWVSGPTCVGKNLAPGTVMPKRVAGPGQGLDAKKGQDHWQGERTCHRWFELIKIHLLSLGWGPRAHGHLLPDQDRKEDREGYRTGTRVCPHLFVCVLLETF